MGLIMQLSEERDVNMTCMSALVSLCPSPTILGTYLSDLCQIERGNKISVIATLKKRGKKLF